MTLQDTLRDYCKRHPSHLTDEQHQGCEARWAEEEAWDNLPEWQRQREITAQRFDAKWSDRE